MKNFLHVGMSVGNNGHAEGLRQVFNVGDWQYEDINVAEPDLNRKLIDLANNYRPELVWIQIQSKGISKEAIEAFKANSGYIIQWCGDKRNRVEDFYFHYAQWGVDLTTFSNMEDVNIMKKCGYDAEFCQIGIDPLIYTNTGTVDVQAPIIFMGNSFQHFPLSSLRRDMVRELKRVYGDQFKAFGSGMPDGAFNGNQPGEAAVYRGAKIGINLSHFDTERYTSDRMFRMLGCGVCVLSHNYKGIEQDFNNWETVKWNDINELKQMINLYLEREDLRLEVAKKGHELAMSKFKFSNMAENILSLYNQYNNDPSKS